MRYVMTNFDIFLQVDNLQEFIDLEIKKKAEKERIKLERALEKAEAAEAGLPSKKNWEQEIKEDTKVQETPDELLRYYFARERAIMEKIFGTDWKKHLKNPDWPRDKYVMAERTTVGSVSSISDEEEKKKTHQRMQTATAKAKGIITFLQMAEK